MAKAVVCYIVDFLHSADEALPAVYTARTRATQLLLQTLRMSKRYMVPTFVPMCTDSRLHSIQTPRLLPLRLYCPNGPVI